MGTWSPSSTSYCVFALLFLLYLFDYIDRLVVVSLFPFLKLDWGLTDTQCGLLVAAVSWSIVVFTLPVSVLVDRWSRRKSISIMCVLWSLATAACAFTTQFYQLFFARVFIGLGESGYAPGGTAMISAVFPEKSRARIMGIWNASIPMGAAMGMALGAIIAERFGWRHAFGIVALPGLLVAVLFLWTKDYKNVDLVRATGRGVGSRACRLDASRGRGQGVRCYAVAHTYLPGIRGQHVCDRGLAGLAAHLFPATARNFHE